MAHGDWRVFIAQSSDLTIVADLTKEAKDKSLSLGLNQPGTFSCGISTKTIWYDYLVPVKYCVVLQRNDEIVWSGPIWTLDESFDGQNIEIGSVGWLEILFHRYHDTAEVTYNLTNAGTIAFNILALANAQHDTWINAGTNSNTQTRTVTVEQWSNYGEQIKDLTESENGIDIEIDPETRDLNIYAASDFQIRNDVVFGYNTLNHNVSNFSRTIDADSMANQYYVQGKIVTAEAHDDPSIAEFGQLLQEVISVTEATDTNFLGAVANAELEVNKEPRTLFSFTPTIGHIAEVGPVLFEHFNIRDQIQVSAERDNVSPINSQAVRVFGATVDIDNNNNERLSRVDITYQSG
jgi:hypothetical protein